MRRVVPALFVSLIAVSLFAQIPEQNVNMVAGTGWPHGDPFLQRQNEPSVAVSTRNPLHLLAGANDYRSVDIPFDTPASPDNEERGDAWLGVFKSRNGGQTWWSDLLPGYPQESPSTSPLHGYQAAADPVVRAGANGMFYYSGIVLNRDSNPLSGVFVARFIDNNNTENGDPIAYVGTRMIDKGSSGAFIDKPWIAVGPGTGQCTVNGQTFPAQNVYLAYTVFVGNGNNLRTKLMFARSTDCGATWSAAQKLSEGYPINQGASIVVSPTGPLYVVWRRFQSTTESNAIMIAKSTDQGQTFTKAAVVRTITPFEQGMTSASIRTNAYPTAAVDSSGHLYVAWADRAPTFNSYGDGRILMVHSADGVSWSDPIVVDPGNARGHQFMPTMTVVGGKIVVAYYDLRDDSTIGVFTNPDHNGRFVETRQPVGDRGSLAGTDPSSSAWVFTQYLQDQAHHRRHTLDLRAAQGSTGVMPVFDHFVRVSRYVFGARKPGSAPTLCASGEGCVEQLQYNVPNLPLFRLGTAPFIGDYIDITGYAPKSSGVYHIVWTDNRDVRPPLDGNWANYTPVSSAAVGSTNKFNGGAVTQCVAGQTGMRNQNIYTTRVTDGVFAGSPGNAKQLAPIQRAFAVFVQNPNGQAKTFRLTILNQPPGGQASFDQLGLATSIDVPVPAHSSATRSVYVSSNVPKASVNIDVSEVGGSLTTLVVINPDVSNPDVSNPDVSNPDVSNPDVSNPDVSNPDVSNAEVHNPDVSNPDVSNPDVSNPDVSNPDVSNPDVSNPDVSNPDVSNPDVSNPDVSNPDVSNPDVSNASVTDTTWTTTNKGNTTSGYDVKLVTNTPIPNGIRTQLIVQRVYQTPNTAYVNGVPTCNLTVQKHYQIISNIIDPVFTDAGQLTTPDPNDATLWLAPGDAARITLRVYGTGGATFDAANSVAAVVVAEAKNNINGVIADSPALDSSLVIITTSTVNDAVSGQPYTTQFTAAGGQPPYTWSTPAGTIDGNGLYSNTFVTPDGPLFITVTATDSTGHSFTKSFPVAVYQPLVLTTEALPGGFQGVPYTATLTATGGKAPYTWHLDKGALPAGLTLDPATGTISGIATTTASSFLLFGVTDSATPSQTAQKDLGFTVGPSHTATIHLTYNGAPVTPTTAPEVFVKNNTAGVWLDPAQIVWNQNDTISVAGLGDANYIIDVASRESAAQVHTAGGFWNQISFTISGGDADVPMLLKRIIHVTEPLDNAVANTGSPCQPQILASPVISWDPIDVPNATYNWQLTKWTCSPGSGTVVQTGTTSGTALTLTPTTANEYYTVTIQAVSPTNIPVGQVMSIGPNWYGWDVRFTNPSF